MYIILNVFFIKKKYINKNKDKKMLNRDRFKNLLPSGFMK